MTIVPWIALLAAVSLLVGIGARGVRRSRFLDINPRYRRALAEMGYTRVEHFLELPSLIVSGHPNRNVARVTLGQGAAAIDGFLKREHRVPWRDYLSSLLAGFGPVSRSGREARLLEALRRAGGRGPEVIAVGQNGRGQAFLLVRTLEDAAALRDLLRQSRVTQPAERLSLARRLGQELARVHAAGFHHADLNSTHVFVGARGDISFVDWQRSQRRGRVGWRERTHDLAALDATLAEELASPRERFFMARAYLQAAHLPPRNWRRLLRRIRSQSRRLQTKRYVRELRSARLPGGKQSLIWLDGEALCVTPEYAQELNGQVPRWLLPLPPHPGLRHWVCRQRLPRVRGTAGLLVQRICDRPARWLWDALRGRRFTSPELHQAGLIFRLERYGIRVPRLLAMGQRHVRPWRTESFLLIEPLSSATVLDTWMEARGSRILPAPPLRGRGARSEGALPTGGRFGPLTPGPSFLSTGERGVRLCEFSAERKQVQRVLRDAGAVLRRLHDAGCYLAGRMPLAVTADGTVGVAAIEDLLAARRARPAAADRDLEAVARCIVRATGCRADALRLLRSYRGSTQRTKDDRRFLRALALDATPGGSFALARAS